MPTLTIVPHGDGAWPDLADRMNRIIYLGNDAEIQMVGLSHGTVTGEPSVALRFDLPDGRIVVAETTLRLFLTAADSLKAVHGDPRR